MHVAIITLCLRENTNTHTHTFLIMTNISSQHNMWSMRTKHIISWKEKGKKKKNGRFEVFMVVFDLFRNVLGFYHIWCYSRRIHLELVVTSSSSSFCTVSTVFTFSTACRVNWSAHPVQQFVSGWLYVYSQRLFVLVKVHSHLITQLIICSFQIHPVFPPLSQHERWRLFPDFVSLGIWW